MKFRFWGPDIEAIEYPDQTAWAEELKEFTRWRNAFRDREGIIPGAYQLTIDNAWFTPEVAMDLAHTDKPRELYIATGQYDAETGQMIEYGGETLGAEDDI